MKLTIKQNILIEHLNNVIKGVSSKNLIPILNCIKFELKSEGLYLMSTDNEIAIKSFIPKSEITDLNTCGDIVIPGRYIYDIVKKLPNKDINIEEVLDSKVFISNDTASFTLNCNKVDEFPNLELEDNKNPIKINKKVFKAIIFQTNFATSTQESRPILTGINFKINENIMECTATDSYRLAKKKIMLQEKIENNIDITIPNKNLNELVKLINEDEEELLEMHIFNNKVIFKFDNIVFMTRLINGSYPDTSKLIPNEFMLNIKVNLNEFYGSLDRASLFSNEDEKNTIKLESSENEIKLLSNIPEIGNVEELVFCKKNNNENIKIAFSSKYMMDAIKSINSEEIELMFNGDVKPIIVKNSESDDLIQLILPIRTY